MRTQQEDSLREHLAAQRRRKLRTAVQTVIAVIICLIAAFPLYWMIISSFKSQDEILLTVPTLWPKEFHF